MKALLLWLLDLLATVVPVALTWRWANRRRRKPRIRALLKG
jgi:hypothetical protein